MYGVGRNTIRLATPDQNYSLLLICIRSASKSAVFCDAVRMQQGDSWTCTECGAVHEGFMEAYSFGAPAVAWQIPAEETRERFTIHNEFAIIDKQPFVQGCIPIRVIGRDTPFYWTVWASLSARDFARAAHLQSVPDEYRRKEPDYEGALANRIKIYPDTMGLKLQIETRPFGQKHFFRLSPADHPFVAEQRDGISLARLREISGLLAHKWRHPLAGDLQERQE